jgi:hypothetical protein
MYTRQSFDLQCSFDFGEYDGFTILGTGSCAVDGGTVPFPISFDLL